MRSIWWKNKSYENSKILKYFEIKGYKEMIFLLNDLGSF
jgi:hypothetical protein